MRLGNIDQFVRALEGERDNSNRIMALQDAHSQMTKLAANLASGEISREALDDFEIRERASETSKDLARIGLSNDRLNRDLVRIFQNWASRNLTWRAGVTIDTTAECFQFRALTEMM